MITTKRTKHPRKKTIVHNLIKALSEKSADSFEQDIKTGELYNEIAAKKSNK